MVRTWTGEDSRGTRGDEKCRGKMRCSMWLRDHPHLVCLGGGEGVQHLLSTEIDV